MGVPGVLRIADLPTNFLRCLEWAMKSGENGWKKGISIGPMLGKMMYLASKL